MEKISINWTQNMTFNANVDGINIPLDAASEHGGENNGCRPKPLMLVALAGCTGMDIASLAKKMRVNIKKLTIDVQAEKTETMPVVYTSFNIEYRFEAEEHDKDKIVKMVTGSQEKYCGVSAMFKHIGPVNFQIYLNDQLINP